MTTVAPIDADHFRRRPAENEWSVAEVLHHLYLVEDRVINELEKALAGELKGFTGVSDPYEEPLAPDVVVETNRESIDFSAGKILLELERRRLIPAAVLNRPRKLRSVFSLRRKAQAKPSTTLSFSIRGSSRTILRRLFLERRVRQHATERGIR